MEQPSNIAVVVQKAYEWNLWIHPHVHKFSRDYRFSLGQQLLDSSLSLLMHLVAATYQSRNATPLSAAMRDVNRLRYLIRLEYRVPLRRGWGDQGPLWDPGASAIAFKGRGGRANSSSGPWSWLWLRLRLAPNMQGGRVFW